VSQPAAIAAAIELASQPRQVEDAEQELFSQVSGAMPVSEERVQLVWNRNAEPAFASFAFLPLHRRNGTAAC